MRGALHPEVATRGRETGFDGPARFWDQFWLAATQGRPPNPVPKATAGAGRIGEKVSGAAVGNYPMIRNNVSVPEIGFSGRPDVGHFFCFSIHYL